MRTIITVMSMSKDDLALVKKKFRRELKIYGSPWKHIPNVLKKPLKDALLEFYCRGFDAGFAHCQAVNVPVKGKKVIE